MSTEYVKIDWELPSGHEKRAEFQIDDSEAHPGRLEMQAVDYEDGEDYGTAYLNRDSVLELRNALSAWLRDNGYVAE